jgi:DNA-binding transcriptional ArsR family regulator
MTISPSRRQAKDALFDALASVAKAMASGRRAEIIELLAQGERTVEEIAAAIGQSVANTSHHLRTLARAGLVRTRREGTWVHYSLASDDVAAMWSAIRRVAARQVDEIERLAAAYLGDRDGLAVIDREELRRRIEDGTVVVVDVRPAAEHAADHIAGAVSIPIDELDQRLDELPPDATVVAYCRGPYCVYADDAVRLLNRQGRAAYRLEDGFPEWRNAGLPVRAG